MFEFRTAQRIVFGRGSRSRLPELIASQGTRPLFVLGREREPVTTLVARMQDQSGRHGQPVRPLHVSGEPTVAKVIDGVRHAIGEHCDLVVAIGGGSVIDAGKAIAALLANPTDPYEYLEVVGKGQPLERPSAPFIAVPTTAGTGAEVTKNAVLQDAARGLKVSLRHDSMLPTIALVDSELTWSVPPEVTAATGLDALTQVLEPYVSHQANPLTDALCLQAMERARESLPRVFRDGSDAAARDDMAFVSLCGGMALANAKLGAVHGLAAPLGGMFPAPHGAVCARLLPFVVDCNLAALRQRAPESPALARYARAASVLTGDASASADTLSPWLERLCAELCVPGFASYGVTREDIPNVVAKAQRSSSMQGNPIALSDDELVKVVELAL